MFFGKKNHLIGLDIGSRTIKVAEVVDSKTGSALKTFNTIDIEPELIRLFGDCKKDQRPDHDGR